MVFITCNWPPADGHTILQHWWNFRILAYVISIQYMLQVSWYTFMLLLSTTSNVCTRHQKESYSFFVAQELQLGSRRFCRIDEAKCYNGHLSWTSRNFLQRHRSYWSGNWWPFNSNFPCRWDSLLHLHTLQLLYQDICTSLESGYAILSLHITR